MKAVVFNVPYGLWNSGETASFSEVEAYRLVVAGVARLPQASIESEGQRDGELQVQPEVDPAPADGKRRGKK